MKGVKPADPSKNNSDETNPDAIQARVIIDDNFESNSDQNSNRDLVKDYLEN